MYLLHSWRRLEAGTSITKGYEHSPGAWGWERITKGYMPGLEAFKVFFLTTCFWEQGLLFHDKTPFRVSPKLCYGLGGGNCILCLNALMFYRERLRASLLYALLPETIYLRKLDNKICQSTRGCPWVSPSEWGPPSLTQNYDVKSMSAEGKTNKLILVPLVTLFLLIFEHRTLHFHFALSPASYAAGPIRCACMCSVA